MNLLTNSKRQYNENWKDVLTPSVNQDGQAFSRVIGGILANSSTIYDSYVTYPEGSVHMRESLVVLIHCRSAEKEKIQLQGLSLDCNRRTTAIKLVHGDPICLLDLDYAPDHC